MSELLAEVLSFINANSTGTPGEYTFCLDGQVSLYASCFAALGLQTTGALSDLDVDHRRAWCDYLNQWQDSDTGLFHGPELASGELTRSDLGQEYVALHLTVHAIPALDILGGKPAHSLRFARKFADLNYLKPWLAKRNWNRAWMEGNNLFFVGMLLVYLMEQEAYGPVDIALNYYFDWLDSEQDPQTGLWGTNGYCSSYEALYGAYHQLLVYHYCNREVRFGERIIDTVLDLQQSDGSFSRSPGGGACEDIDAIDVLINQVKRTEYRLPDVQRASMLTLQHVLNQQSDDGGFVYKWGRSYMQSGVLRTFTPVDTPDLFSTWFRMNTLALINEVVSDPTLEKIDWRFNPSISMGWHNTDLEVKRSKSSVNRGKRSGKASSIRPALPSMPKSRLKNSVGKIVGRIPTQTILKLNQFLISQSLPTMTPGERLDYLLQVEEFVDSKGDKITYDLGSGLKVEFWWSQSYRYFSKHIRKGMVVWHLGCQNGTLSYSLASKTSAWVTASDRTLSNLAPAEDRYQHPRLEFISPNALAENEPTPDIVVLTDWNDGRPAWSEWEGILLKSRAADILVQFDPSPIKWKEIAAVERLAIIDDELLAKDLDTTLFSGLMKEVDIIYGTRFGHIVPADK